MPTKPAAVNEYNFIIATMFGQNPKIDLGQAKLVEYEIPDQFEVDKSGIPIITENPLTRLAFTLKYHINVTLNPVEVDTIVTNLLPNLLEPDFDFATSERANAWSLLGFYFGNDTAECIYQNRHLCQPTQENKDRMLLVSICNGLSDPCKFEEYFSELYMDDKTYSTIQGIPTAQAKTMAMRNWNRYYDLQKEFVIKVPLNDELIYTYVRPIVGDMDAKTTVEAYRTLLVDKLEQAKKGLSQPEIDFD